MRSIKEQRRDDALGVEQIELLDWAERARFNIMDYLSVLVEDGRPEDDEIIAELSALLKELPSE